jgi:hypothetical protein
LVFDQAGHIRSKNHTRRALHQARLPNHWTINWDDPAVPVQHSVKEESIEPLVLDIITSDLLNHCLLLIKPPLYL